MDAIDPTAVPQMRTAMDLQTAVAKKLADLQKLQGTEVLKLLDAVAQIAGAPQADGQGEQIDERA